MYVGIRQVQIVQHEGTILIHILSSSTIFMEDNQIAKLLRFQFTIFLVIKFVTSTAREVCA